MTDLPQNLTGTAVYQLPFGHGHFGGDNAWVNAVGGGWNLSGIFTYHSGAPLTATGSGCGGSSILGQCMPSTVPSVAARTGKYGSNVTADPKSPNYYGNVKYLNPAAFTVNNSCTAAPKGTTPTTCPSYGGQSGQTLYVGNGPALYVPGNAARVGADGVRSMGSYDLDMGLKRTFAVYQNYKLQFEADMSNVTNHVVWGAVSASGSNNSVGTSGFGEIGGPVSQPRDVQFAGRLIW